MASHMTLAELDRAQAEAHKLVAEAKHLDERTRWRWVTAGAAGAAALIGATVLAMRMLGG